MCLGKGVNSLKRGVVAMKFTGQFDLYFIATWTLNTVGDIGSCDSEVHFDV